jgi:hypothetical protein
MSSVAHLVKCWAGTIQRVLMNAMMSQKPVSQFQDENTMKTRLPGENMEM